MKAIKKAFVFLLITAVFVSSNGVVLAIHTCNHSLAKSVSLFDENDCCGEEKQCRDTGDVQLKEVPCCFSEFAYYKLDISTLQKQSVDHFEFYLPEPIKQLTFTSEKVFVPVMRLPDKFKDLPVLFSCLLI